MLTLPGEQQPMALVQVHFFSQALLMNCSMNVTLPERNLGPKEMKGNGGKLPVLYLLHGATEDHTAWQRHTAIERYAEPLGLAVVMPAGQLSFYNNMISGGAYFDFIAEELPRLCGEFFNISDKREDSFIAGTSMGGYGALRIGLAKPERYRAIGCFSMGAFMRPPEGKVVLDPLVSRWLKLAFGVERPDELKGTDCDPVTLAEKNLQAGKIQPRIFHVCGIDDDPQILSVSRLTRDLLRGQISEDYEYHEGPGGHTWDFWNEWIQVFLKWLAQ
jgi:putative tributyrin esterase